MYMCAVLLEQPIISASTLYVLLTKMTAAEDAVVLTYDRVRGLYFLAVISRWPYATPKYNFSPPPTEFIYNL